MSDMQQITNRTGDDMDTTVTRDDIDAMAARLGMSLERSPSGCLITAYHLATDGYLCRHRLGYWESAAEVTEWLMSDVASAECVRRSFN